ncbi:hypothetical protein [Sphingomonas koreensis]
MRPQSIVRFEQAYLASVVTWGVNLAVRWKPMLASFEDQPAIAGNPQMAEVVQTVLVVTALFSLMLWLLLWYFTARRASEVTKWVVVVFFGISALSLPLSLMSYPVVGALSTGLTVVTFAFNAVAVWMLFRPDARNWLAGDSAQPDTAPFE